MDGVDLAILGQMTSSHAPMFGGLDPRVSPETMAKQVGLDPSSIRARIRGWRTSGFLRGWFVLPHPALLGMEHYVAYVGVPGHADRQALGDAIQLAEGAFCRFEHVHGWTGIGMYANGEATAMRRAALLAHHPGISALRPPGHVRLAECDTAMSRADWRIVLALCERPEAPLRDIATAADVSANTASKRFHGLVERHAIFSVADLDFTKFTGGTLVRCFVDLDAGTDPGAFTRKIATQYPHISFYRETTTPNQEGHRTAHFMVHLAAMAAIDDLEHTLLRTPGARHIKTAIPRAFVVTPDWVREQVTEAAARAAQTKTHDRGRP